MTDGVKCNFHECLDEAREEEENGEPDERRRVEREGKPERMGRPASSEVWRKTVSPTPDQHWRTMGLRRSTEKAGKPAMSLEGRGYTSYVTAFVARLRGW
ncbi:hypothetical protein NDU88_003754 [Pleurodeles waltl]|uniref:Uncharacterized protein n=1 Tax=Pleurodeles waltl TaxID=8319 RepID=A0AAV7VIA9_PLEWA|nr:hypothetical protein NDU88_003754 [Pleurodeles waltl]